MKGNRDLLLRTGYAMYLLVKHPTDDKKKGFARCVGVSHDTFGRCCKAQNCALCIVSLTLTSYKGADCPPARMFTCLYIMDNMI